MGQPGINPLTSIFVPHGYRPGEQVDVIMRHAHEDRDPHWDMLRIHWPELIDAAESLERR